ncbi:MAG: 6-phosphofructokinase [Chlorobi bacterium]|nr:6-phosphofructokinase [Chlorobiota bacterium]MCI0715852.1 6-phosphofructokinase [Chlorobiota bacterium]
MKVGILTGGGDCPGLNAVIRAIVRKSIRYGWENIGIENGWKGLMEIDTRPLDLNAVSGILQKGGTILGTSRTNPYKFKNGEKTVIENSQKIGLDALVAIGGEDTLGVANKLSKAGYKVVGVPKTIDNDLNGTDYTFGFDTAVNIAMDAIDRIHTTAESHHRAMIIEVMGRHAGWIAMHAGIAGGADLILIPEKEIKLDDVINIMNERAKRGRTFSIIVVAEGAKISESDQKNSKLVTQDKKLDAFGHVRLGGIASVLAEIIEKKTGIESRATILGHIQRGGSPTAFDRVLGSRFGVYAVEMIKAGKFGRMAALKGAEIVDIPIDEAVSKTKTVGEKFYDTAKVFFG